MYTTSLFLNQQTNIAVIYHIATKADVEASKADRSYRCESLKTEGFIHCCQTEQMAGVVERYYTGVPDLLVLTIDPERLTADLVFENTVGGEELFPHVYGEINNEAVTGILSLDEYLRN